MCDISSSLAQDVLTKFRPAHLHVKVSPDIAVSCRTEAALSLACRNATSDDEAAKFIAREEATPVVVPKTTSNQHSESFKVPRQVGKYRIVRTLGKGCFGRVLLGQNPETEEKVAIKYVQKHSTLDSKVKRTINREVCLLKLLNHPNIIRTFEVLPEHPSIDSGDFIAVVMENIEGGELFDYINEHGSLPEDRARKWFRQLVSAIEYCQKNFLVHRDLKPENVLIDSNDNIKLIDFGFANFFSKNSLLKTFCGSPFYAAPEVIQGVPYVGPEVDVWSLGITLYTMLCGKLPFEAENMSELLDLQKKGAYSKSGLSADAERILKKMLEVNPKKRATIDEIKSSYWLNKNTATPLQSFLPSNRRYPVLDPDPDAVKFIVDLGYRKETVCSLLATQNEHPLFALYYLFIENKMRNCAQSSTNSIQMTTLITPTTTKPPLLPIERDKPKQQSTTQLVQPAAKKTSLKGFFLQLFSACFFTTKMEQRIHPESTTKQRQLAENTGTSASKQRFSLPSQSTAPFDVKIEWGFSAFRGVCQAPQKALYAKIENVLRRMNSLSYHKTSPNEYSCTASNCKIDVVLCRQSQKASSKNALSKKISSFAKDRYTSTATKAADTVTNNDQVTIIKFYRRGGSFLHTRKFSENFLKCLKESSSICNL